MMQPTSDATGELESEFTDEEINAIAEEILRCRFGGCTNCGRQYVYGVFVCDTHAR